MPPHCFRCSVFKIHSKPFSNPVEYAHEDTGRLTRMMARNLPQLIPLSHASMQRMMSGDTGRNMQMVNTSVKCFVVCTQCLYLA